MIPDQYPLPPSEPQIPTSQDITDLWQQDLNRRTVAVQGGPITVNLPSGKPVRAHRIHVMHLLMNGNVPDALLPLVEKLIRGTTPETAAAAIEEISRDFEKDELTALKKFTALLDHVWLNSVVEPKFVAGRPDPAKRELPIAVVPFDDKLYLYQWNQGVTADIASFRAEQERVMEALQNGENIRDTAMHIIRRQPVRE